MAIFKEYCQGVSLEWLLFATTACCKNWPKADIFALEWVLCLDIVIMFCCEHKATHRNVNAGTIMTWLCKCSYFYSVKKVCINHTIVPWFAMHVSVGFDSENFDQCCYMYYHDIKRWTHSNIDKLYISQLQHSMQSKLYSNCFLLNSRALIALIINSDPLICK